MPELHELVNTFPRSGRVEWIGLAEQRLGDVQPQRSVSVEPGTGIAGEHHARSGKSHRQVTLIQYEHLAAVAALLKREQIDPALLRRNIAVSGINLLALKHGTFRIGTALLEGTGPCAPCSRMEANLGPGGYNVMRGHGGITAIVVEGGEIRVGDDVTAREGFAAKDE
jgi:MOSC domain-containing protein YiiM